MTIGDQKSGQARCRMKWQVADVEKNVMSAGKVTDTGLDRIILDSEGSYLIHKPSGKQVQFRQNGEHLHAEGFRHHGGVDGDGSTS